MNTKQAASTTIDEYIARFSPEVQSILERVRGLIKKAAPAAVEKISYGMPTFVLNGALVHFGAFKNHLGLFPPVKDKKLRLETAKYQGEKGNLKFPYDEPIPYDLIRKVVKTRISESRRGKE